MIRSLRRKFIRIAMVSVTLVVALMGLLINVLNFISTDRDLGTTLEMICDNRGTVPEMPHTRPGEKPKGDFSPETPYETRYFTLFYDETGTLLYADLRNIAAVDEEGAQEYLTAAWNHGAGDGYRGGYKFRVVSNGAGLYMAVFLDCRKELNSLASFALVSLLVSVLCIALVLVLVLLLSRRAIDPMVRSAEKQKQFITDASHELKTPITVIATSLRVLEMEVGQQKWIDKARAQTEKLTQLVNELIALTRLDEETPARSITAFDIGGVVQETAESFVDYAAAQGHELALSIETPVPFRGDEYAIRQLLSVLLDNGVKYADSGSPITLTLTAEKRGVVLRTENPCAGLTRGADLRCLFDRFYRGDSARTRQESGGFGVGLSLAQGIVQAHRGTIRAECPEDGLIRFTATLRGAS